MQRYKYRNMVRDKNTEVKKYNHVRKYKEILHIWTVKQRHRKEIFGTKTINLYFSLLGGFCPVPNYMMGTTSGAGLLTIPVHISSLPVFIRIRIDLSIVFCGGFVDHALFISCPFSFGNFIVCPSAIYNLNLICSYMHVHLFVIMIF